MADKTVGSHSVTVNTDANFINNGTYWLLAKIDSGNSITESNETNNVAIGNQVTICFPPIISPFSRSLPQDTVLTFSAADFQFSVAPAAIEVDTPLYGTLKLNGVTLTGHTSIPLAQIGGLTYTPPAGYVGADMFNWTGVDQYGQYPDPELSVTVATVDLTVTAVGNAKLTGTIIGTAGSYLSKGNTIAKVFDGNTTTFFDGPATSGNWVGLDLRTAQRISKVRYYPRATFGNRMVGGKFQGSNTADFSSGVVDLFTITTVPTGWTDVAISNTGMFRYVRYLAPANSYGNIAELEFYTPVV